MGKMYKISSTSIIIPLYNEEIRLNHCFDILKKFLIKKSKLHFEIIFVNDGSTDQSKNKILKVPKNTIKKYGAVSEQVCLSMAKNLFKISKTNIYVAITGIAGPGGATKNKPVGLVYICFGKGNKIKTNKYLLKNRGRSYIQKAIVKKSLELIIAIIK